MHPEQDAGQALTHYQFTIEQAISKWIAQKRASKSNSEKTATAYRETVRSFRLTLAHGGLDLLDNPKEIARVAPIWAAMRHPEAKRTGDISDATYNQRLAILSSFYTFLQKTYRLQIENPIKSVPKRRVQAYRYARALSAQTIMERLSRINRGLIQGKRDYALLALGAMTGRRASELLALQWKDITLENGITVVTFEHCKGGKIMRDALDPGLAAAFFDYLTSIYGNPEDIQPEAPVWISLSKRNRGKPLSSHTFNDICERYLDTTQIHTLRHTFAKEMENAGATLSEIQDRLGHEDIATTARYLKAMGSAHNRHASKLAERFGILRKGITSWHIQGEE